MLLLLLSCVALNQSQWSSQTQFVPHLRQNGNRRISRRVGGPGPELDNRGGGLALSKNNLDSPDTNRRMFSPLFLDNTDVNDAYLMIDPQRFTIIPAVPQPTAITRSQKSLENTKQTNIFFPSRPRLRPVTAVPDQSSTVIRHQHHNSISDPARGSPPLPVFNRDQNRNSFSDLAREAPRSPPPVLNRNTISDIVKEAPIPPPPVLNTIPDTGSSLERKKFKKCHGRCVQKFCLPVGSLAKHAECQDSCKDICSV